VRLHHLVAAAALVAALACSPAAAHGGGGQVGDLRLFVSTITAVEPPLDGLELAVLEFDDRLRLDNRTGREVVILGYEDEPYLRFDAGGGVWENRNSPAAYLNEDRLAEVAVPAAAGPEAEPDWRRLSQSTVWEWHDHRIHWMSPVPPPAVRADPDTAREVLRWTVPATAAGEPVRIRGVLAYEPQESGPPLLAAVAAVGVALVLGGALVAGRRLLGGREAPRRRRIAP
jgi:hypothetical protein